MSQATLVDNGKMHNEERKLEGKTFRYKIFSIKIR